MRIAQHVIALLTLVTIANVDARPKLRSKHAVSPELHSSAGGDLSTRVVLVSLTRKATSASRDNLRNWFPGASIGTYMPDNTFPALMQQARAARALRSWHLLGLSGADPICFSSRRRTSTLL